MKNPTALTAVAAIIGVTCAWLLVRLWREDVGANPVAPAPKSSTTSATSVIATPKPAQPVADVPPLDPKLQTLLTELVRAIVAGNARDREAVLTFKDDTAMQRFVDRARRSGVNLIAQSGRLRAVRVGFEDLNAFERTLRESGADVSDLAANGYFGVPQPPARENRADVSQVPFRNDTLAFLGAEGDRTAWGRGTTIAVLDTGVAADTTFGTGRLRTLDIGLGLTPGTGTDDGHGTAVAALAAGLAKDAGGVAPNASVLSIRVTDSGGLSDLFTISKAIVTAVEAGAKIINVSLGGYTTGAVLDAAIHYATQNGAVIVAAAGNDQAAQLAWPAADPRVVSVGAVDKAEQQVSFSNSGAQLQLTAPGYGVQTAWLDGQRVYVDGTSASAPLVAGAIAAIVSQNPSLTPRQAAELLAQTANDAGAPGTDPAFGHGIINLATALNRNNATYVDTAVSSHYFDAASGQMQFVVQNRSGRTVTGMSLSVTAGTTTTTQSVPSLAAGETYVAKVPVNDVALQSAGGIPYTSQLVNPVGTTDQVPANNKRTTILTAPKPAR
jgi:hypothetical protein